MPEAHTCCWVCKSRAASLMLKPSSTFLTDSWAMNKERPSQPHKSQGVNGGGGARRLKEQAVWVYTTHRCRKGLGERSGWSGTAQLRLFTSASGSITATQLLPKLCGPANPPAPN